MAKRRQSKEQRDRERERESRQYRVWRKWRNDRVRALLAGPHGAAVQELLRTLKNLPPSSALWAQLQAGPWRSADADTRHEILSLVGHAITKHREARGLSPFDDPVPGCPDNLYLKLREWLTDPND